MTAIPAKMPSRRPAVLVIVENLPVPFDRRVWYEARTLTESGYRVAIISPKAQGYEASYEKREGIEIYRHKLREASRPLGYLGEYAWALAAQFSLALRVYFRTRFRVIHACNPPDTIFLVALPFKLAGVRFIFDHHDLNPELFETKFGGRGLLYRMVCLAERLTFRTADVSIATNQSFREIALSRGKMPPARVFVVRSAPDLTRVRRGQAQPALKEGRRHLVVYLGVMGAQDGVDLLLDSIEFLTRRIGRNDTLFVLIGGGTDFGRFRALATAKRLDGVVRFTGRISEEENALDAYLSTADVGVAPDPRTPMNDKSTMNKILQYMAYGVPVVLYDLTEGRRSAEDAALYARPNDPQDFAARIVELLDSEALRKRLGERGRRRIEQELNWQMESRTLLAAYETAVAARGRRAG